jgi:hypothetical protein
MSYGVKFKMRPNYLLVQFTGELTTKNAFDSIERIRYEADQKNYKLILLDLRGVTNLISEMTRFYAGEKIANVFRHDYKIAVFMLNENINKLAETVALNRGANFKVFDSEHEAIQWLTNKD